MNENQPEYTTNTNVTAIKRSTIAPGDEIKNAEHTISSPDSPAPIYAWFDNGTIYWYSGADSEYLNEDASYMFAYFTNATEIDTNFSTSNTTNMSNLFNHVGATSLDLSNFDTYNVTDMSAMFANTNITNLNVSNFETGKVTDMNTMFAGATTLTLNLSNFDTSNVTNMNTMFAGSNIPILDLSSFDTSNVTNMKNLFASSKVTTLDLSNFNTSNVTDFSNAFSGTSELISLNISGWDFSKTKSIAYLFASSPKLAEINLNNVNTENVENISNLFQGDSSLTLLDLSDFNVSSVTNLSGLFTGCSSVRDIDISGWSFDSITSISSLFGGLTSLETINLENVNTSNITNMGGLFSGSTKIKSLDLTSFDVSNVTTFSLFGGNTDLKTIDISGWNFNSVTSLSGFFASGLTGLESINFTDVDTSKITNMAGMFSGCSSLKTLDLTSFDTNKVTDMGSMFYNCSSLTTITVSDDFEVEQVTSSGGMFAGDTSLVGGAGTPFDPSHHDKEYAHYDYSDLWPGYFNMGDVNIYTITYNPNGGEVDPTSRTIIEGSRIKNLPVPTKTGYIFKGWYTGLTDGVKISERTTVYEDVTYYAHWYNEKDITYNSNTGTFENDATTNPIHYEYKSQELTKYSHTPNINDQGVASGVYDNYLDVNDVVTIPGATSINIELWYSTESSQYNDWLAIYPKNASPTSNNYSEASISGGKLYGGGYNSKPSDDSYYHKTFTVQGDTAQFYFHSNYSNGYYGYYAIVTGTGYDYDRSQPYQTPTKASYKFTGWNTKADGTGTTYKTEDAVINAFDTLPNNQVLYAQWLEQCTVTYNPNGGILQWYSSETFDKGSKINYLPQAFKQDGSALDGWYTELNGGIKVDKDYVIDHTQTLYAHWSGVQAKFDTGTNVNTKFKLLAGNTTTATYPYTGYPLGDSNITAIKRATTAPDITTLTLDENIVSDPNSGVPIYAWYDNGTIYWWSSAGKEYLNEDASYMFANYSSLTDIDTNFDTSLTENMYYMFGDCRALLEIDVSGFNTHKVTNLSYMFYTGSGMKKLDLSNFDTSNCTNMYSVAGYMNSLEELNLSNWDFSKYNPDTSLVNNLTSYNSSIKKLIMNNTILPANLDHFAASISNIEEISLRNADATRATTMRYMFYYDSKLKKVDMHGVTSPNVTNMEYMFNDDSNLETLDISSLTTDKVTTMLCMFNNCDKLESLDFSSWNTSRVSDFRYLVGNCDNLKEVNMNNFDFSNGDFSSNKMYNIWYGSNNLEKLTVDNAKFPSYMEMAFYGMRNLKTFSAKNVDTSNVTDMSYMFENWESIELIDLTDFDTHNVMKMNFMFSYMYNLKTILVGDDFVVNQVMVHNEMFKDSTKIEGGAGTKWKEAYIDKTRAHWDGGLDNPGYFQKKGRVSISFDPNGGKLKFKAKEVKLGDPIGTLPRPKHGDNEFLGWYTGITDGDKIDDPTYIPPQSMKLYARWKYNITFEPNGGEVSETSRVVISGNEMGQMPVPTKANSIFAGWYTLPRGGIRVGSDYIPNDSITLFANWKDIKTITYDATEGTFDNSETTNTITYTFGERNVTKYSHTSNVADDGTANGTYPANLNVNDVVRIDDASSINIEVWYSTESTNYDWLAIYPKGATPNQNNYNDATISNGKLGNGRYSTKPTAAAYHKTYTVNDDTAQFYFRSDSGGNYYGYYAIITGIGRGYTGNTEYKVPDKNGYYFEWNTRRDGNGKQYASEEEVLADMDNLENGQTLYAIWRIPGEYTITFDATGGEVSPTSKTVTERDPIGELPEATWNKHIFLGWYDAEEGGNKITESYVPTKTQTLYAHWKNIWTVTLEANGGEVSPTTIEVEDGQRIGELPEATWNKHVFTGWYTGLTSGEEIDEYYRPRSNQTIYAHWKNIWTVTLNPNATGGTVDPDHIDVVEGEPLGKLPKAKSRYAFVKWTEEIDGGIEITSSYEPTGNKTIYAQYSKIPHTENFGTDNWDAIVELAEVGSCGTYKVGDTREIDMGEYGVHTIRLANCTTPPECSDPNFSQTACGFVMEFDDIITKHPMNNASGSCINDYGSWPATEMRRFVNNEIYNALPEDIKSSIIPTRVVTGIGGYEYAYQGNRSNYVSEDKLYLLSAGEVWGNRGSWNAVDYDTAINQSRQLDYYAAHGVSTSLANHSWPVVKKFNGEAEWWRLRNPIQRYIIWEDGSVHTPMEKPSQTIYANFSAVAKDGGQGRDDCGAHFQMGVSPAFRIGPKLGWELTNDKEPLTGQKWVYWLNKNEKIEDGWYRLDDFYGNKGNYYFENGYAKTGWHTENGDKYYLSTFDEDGNGYMNCNRLENTSKEIDGTVYTFDENGRCTNCN